MKDEKKRISIVVPIYNEISMVEEICCRVRAVFEKLPNYDYEIVFFDDGSTDGTRAAIETLCAACEDVKCVFYARNFGYMKSTFYCMQQAKGDCAIILHADLQNPPECIPEFVQKWENGAQVVLGVKKASRENSFIYFLRTVFYFLMTKFFGVNMTPHATEFELFDSSFIDILKQIRGNTPFLRGIIGEYASRIDYVYYTQDARTKGRSKFNLNKYYDFALCGITQYSVCLPRKIFLFCIIALCMQITEFCTTIVPGITLMDSLTLMNAVILRCILVALGILTILVCILFEYVISINRNTGEKPLILEEKRIHY